MTIGGENFYRKVDRFCLRGSTQKVSVLCIEDASCSSTSISATAVQPAVQPLSVIHTPDDSAACGHGSSIRVTPPEVPRSSSVSIFTTLPVLLHANVCSSAKLILLSHKLKSAIVAFVACNSSKSPPVE